MRFPFLFARRYLFARPAIVVVNLVAGLATAAALLGATAALTAARGLWAPDALAGIGYGAALLLSFIATALLAKAIKSPAIFLGVGLGLAVLGAFAALFLGGLTSAWDVQGQALQPGTVLPGDTGALLIAVALGLAVGAGATTVGVLALRRAPANVINLIASISAFGLGVGAAAVILVLSVFNGFEEVIGEMFGKFNPAVKVLPARGKAFSADTLPLQLIRDFDGVTAVSLTLEETAFFEYRDSRAFGKVKGVDSAFAAVSGLDSALIEGQFLTESGGRNYGVLGLGLRNKLNVNPGSAFAAVQVYAARRKARGAFDQPFRTRSVYPGGTFAVQQDYDQQYLFTELSLARELLGLPTGASAIELAVRPGTNAADVADKLAATLGPNYVVLDRLEQDADLLRLMNIEKWLSYVILTLVLLLVSFNLVGGLWLIVLEKERDITILRAMGTSAGEVRTIFLLVGLLLSILGALLGLALAGLLYWLQVNYGLIAVPEGLVVSAYPVDLRAVDVAVVFATVIVIGLLASVPAARRAAR